MKAESATPGPETEFAGTRLYLLMGALVMAFFLVTLDMSIVATATPYITSQFHSLSDVGWYGSAYQLSCASLLPLAGKMYSNFRPKPLFLTYLALFETGSLLCGVARDSRMLIVGRAVAGMGSSGLMNGGLTIASTAVPLAKRPVYFGVMMGVAQLGVVCGPVLGGVFTESVTWRWCFFLNLPIGALVAATLYLIQFPTMQTPSLPLKEIVKTKLDLLGFILFAPAAIQSFLALDYAGHQYPWNSSVVIGLLCGSFVNTILFIFWEHRQGENGMVPLPILRLAPVWSACAVMVLFFGTLQTATYYLPIYFQTVKRASPVLGGVYTLPGVLGHIVFAAVSGVGITKIGHYLPFSLASAVLMTLALALIATWTPTTPPATWIGEQILLGAGRGLGMQAPLLAVQNSVPKTSISVAMALISFSQTLGGAVYLAVDDAVLGNQLVKNMGVYAPGVDVGEVVKGGLTIGGIERAVNGDANLVGGMLDAYARSVSAVFYLAAGSAGGILFVAWFYRSNQGMKERESTGEGGGNQGGYQGRR